MITPRLRAFLIGVVTIVWAVSFIAPLFRPDYKPPPEMNVAFMAILGLITATNTKPPPPSKNPKDLEE